MNTLINAQKPVIQIGIDCGVKTGFAVAVDGELRHVSTETITKAMTLLNNWRNDPLVGGFIVYIEDARKRTWVTGGREKLQGVGSVKRDCGIWEQFCIEQGIRYELVHPKNNSTKLSAEQFKKITGWTGRTSEHGRDAAMLIFGRKK